MFLMGLVPRQTDAPTRQEGPLPVPRAKVDGVRVHTGVGHALAGGLLDARNLRPGGVVGKWA